MNVCGMRQRGGKSTESLQVVVGKAASGVCDSVTHCGRQRRTDSIYMS